MQEAVIRMKKGFSFLDIFWKLAAMIFNKLIIQIVRYDRQLSLTGTFCKENSIVCTTGERLSFKVVFQFSKVLYLTIYLEK